MRHPQQKAMKLLSASIALPSLAVLQLLLLIIQLFQTPATILAQRPYSIDLYDCPDDTTNKYATGSQFEKNLKNLLFPSLISHGSRDGGFFNTSSGAGQDTIYGLVQCRFDVSKGNCQRCLSIASVLILQKCPHQMDAVIRLEDCLLRYSNVIFFSQLRNLDDLDYTSYPLDYIKPTDLPAFSKQLKGLFTNLTSLAISKPSKYQTGSSNFSLLSDNIIIYGLVECTRDLSNTVCQYCLEYMFSKIRDCCSGYISAWVLSLSCQIWYRDLKFFEPPIEFPIKRSIRRSPRTAHPDSPSPRTSPGSPSPRTSPDSPSPAANITGDTNGTKNKTHQENSKARIYMVVIPVVATVVLFAVVFSICVLSRKATREKAHRGTMQTSSVHLEGAASSPSRYFELNESERKGVDVPFVDFDTILTATDNFSISNKLGQGGFGPVYKGTFKGGQELAVKRLSRSSGQGLEEFRNEVLLIAKLQHRNLVKLLGYCIKDDEKVLLYEYMPNKSLDSFIFGDRTFSLTINWEKRLDIILGIARGILYLHQDSRLRIIHRDLKTSNILLDEEMNPKISDFGLARICGGTETEGSTNRVVGTYGYMAPEYALDGLFSVKSDVYSFGVVLLEIVSGKKNSGFHVSEDSLSFIRYAWRLWNENKVLDFLDDSLCEACNGSEVLKCIQVGLLCVQEDADDRPTMSSAVFMLGSEATNLPTPKQPAFVFRRYQSTTTTSSGKPESCSKNEITVSAEEGR